MANLHLVTGYAGKPHVAAADMASQFAGTIRPGEYVMATGKMFAATAITSNTVRILDGELMLQGRHIKMDPGTYADLHIDNGTQGRKRLDLIVCRYTRNTDTGVEDAQLAVIKGTPISGEPKQPQHKRGDIIGDRAAIAEMPLYTVRIDGLNVEQPQPLFKPQSTLYGLLQQLSQVQANTVHQVAGGTSGDWQYRKWSDGTAACWCTLNCGTVSCTNKFESVYESTQSYGKKAYPFPFVGVPVELATVGGTSGPVAWIYSGDGPTSERSQAYYFLRPASGSMTASISIYAMGRWE